MAIPRPDFYTHFQGGKWHPFPETTPFHGRVLRRRGEHFIKLCAPGEGEVLMVHALVWGNPRRPGECKFWDSVNGWRGEPVANVRVRKARSPKGKVVSSKTHYFPEKQPSRRKPPDTLEGKALRLDRRVRFKDEGQEFRARWRRFGKVLRHEVA